MNAQDRIPTVATTPAPYLFLSLPTWIRAGGTETQASLSLVEQIIPAGFASAWHIHHDEDESFYVLDGEITVIVDRQSVTLGAGGFAYGPRGIAHGFHVSGDRPAHILLITSGPSFAEFIREASDPFVDPAQLKAAPDFARLMAVAEKYGLSILGPIPE